MKQLYKIYASNFLTGLVFFYGIERVFMKSIGIDAVDIGIIVMVLAGLNMFLDVPAGIIADRWSRKGMLMLSALFIIATETIYGSSSSLWMYLMGTVFFSLYVVSTSGVYQAITYDLLRDLKRERDYSRVAGLSYGLYLIGAAVGNAVGGVLGAKYGLRFPFYISIISGVLNFIVLATLKEPKYHKQHKSENILKQFSSASSILWKMPILRSLVVFVSLMAAVETFKLEFGQLYFLRYMSSLQLLGLLWGLFAALMGVGSFIAHRIRKYLTVLIVMSTFPYVLMSFMDSWAVIILFMMQVVAYSAAVNIVETDIQHATPSHVRASVISVMSTFCRFVSVPAALIIGWTMKHSGSLLTVRLLAGVCTISLLIWLFTNKKQLSSLTAS